MDALRSLVSPLGMLNGTSVVDGVKLVVLGGTVETARRVSSSAWSHFVNSFFLTAHFSEEDHPYDWLMLWLSRRPEWQRSREFDTTTRAAHAGAAGWEELDDPALALYFPPPSSTGGEEEPAGPSKTRVHFQPTMDTTHTIYWRQHWLRVRRTRGDGVQMLSVSVVARSNAILKALVLTAKREYEREAVHRIQIFLAEPHGSWRWADARHKRPMGSIVLDPGVKEMLLGDARDFLASEKWYADRGIPFRRGYLLHGVPGSGKSSLIHAIAGELMLDVYVVSLSSAWISDSMLMGLMGRVPKGAILLLEDLDAAFTRSTSRRSSSPSSPSTPSSTSTSSSSSSTFTTPSSSEKRRRRRDREDSYYHGGGGGGYGMNGMNEMNEMNTLSLSGLLNALDGVAAAEGRILFATTNHLEKLDPALSRPGRMDVWVEFKNASRWQAEALFRNFFPSAEDEEADDLPFDDGNAPPQMPQFGSSNEAYLPPPVAPEIAAAQHAARPLDARTLAALAKRFADAVPEGEFSVAALQGYLLKNKSRPEAAAGEAAAWVVSEREMRERLKMEKEARETRERIEREKRKAERAAKAAKKKEEKEKQKEKEKAQAAANVAVPPPSAAPVSATDVPTTMPTPAAQVTAPSVEAPTTALPPPPAEPEPAADANDASPAEATTETAPEAAADDASPAPAPPAADTAALPAAMPVPVTEAPPEAPAIAESFSDSDSEESDEDDDEPDIQRIVPQPQRRISPWAAPIRPAHSPWLQHPPPSQAGSWYL